MANAFYPTALEAFLKATLGDLTSVTVKVHLIDTAADPYDAANDFENDILDAAIEGTTTITVTSATGGELDSGATTFTAPAGTDSAEAMIIWVDTTVDTTSPLICFIDTFASGMPVTPDGVADVIVTWASGVVFAITTP